MGRRWCSPEENSSAFLRRPLRSRRHCQAGSGIGAAAGILLGRYMLALFFEVVDPGTFTVPWLEVGGILLLAYVFSLVTTILPAYQASRIYPAEALRYEF